MAHQKLLYFSANQLKHFSRNFSFSRTNLGIFSKFYESCIKYPQLTAIQANTRKSEELLNSKITLTDLCWSNLQLNENKLREIEYKLDPLSTIDSHYPPLLQDEVLVMQRLKILSQDLYSYHLDEVDGTNSHAFALRNGIISYHETEKRMKLFLFASILLGLLIGYLLAFYWEEFIDYLTGRERIHSNNDLKALIKKIADMIRTNNIILYRQLDDLRLLSLFQDDAFVCQSINQISTESFKNDESFLSECASIVSSIDKKDEMTSKDMIRIEKGLLKQLQFNQLPELVVMSDSSRINNDEKGLWYTICAYISAAVILPIALFAMAET